MPKILYILLFVLAVPAAAENDFFTLYGLEFPGLKNDEWLADDRAVLYSRHPIKFDIYFYLDESGRVDSFTYQSVHKDIFVEKLRPSFMASAFYAARLDGHNIPFVLPAELTIDNLRGRSRAVLTLPFDERSCTLNRRLVEKAMELNGWELPRLENFPSYFVTFSETPGIKEYPYVVYKVSVDSLGQLGDYEPYLSYGGDFSSFLENPLLYAVFSPLTYHGRGLNSEIYIIFRLFGVVDYPTAVWPQGTFGKKDLPFEALRIEICYFRDSILNRPIPYNLPDGIYICKEIIPFVDTVRAEVELNPDGNVVKYSILESSPALLEKQLRNMIELLKFTPACDWQHQKMAFRGILEFTFNNDKNVRVVAEWLPRSAQVPVTE